MPAGLSGVTAIAAGWGHSVALKSDGTVVAWGAYDYGQTTVPDGLSGVTAIAAGGDHTVALLGTAPTIVTQPQPGSQTVFVGANVTFTVVASGSPTPTYQWKKDTVNIPGATSASYHVASVQPSDAGSYTVVVNPPGTVTSDAAVLTVIGPVVAWGANNLGQTTVPAGLSAVASIAAGGEHSVALKSDGTVVEWGANDFGQATIPAGLSGVTAIAAGGRHTVALMSGTVVAWGFNNYGQTNIPVGLSGVTAIAAGYDHTVVLKGDGTVAAWGYSAVNVINVPAGLSGVTAIAAGYYHTVALKSNGTVVAWGWNDSGRTTVPAGLSGVTAIAAGGYHTVVLKNDGTVVTWGLNNLDQTTVPTGLSGVTAIAAGGAHTVALIGPAAPLTVTLNFASWQTKKFTPTQLANPLISGPDADPDMDGLKNIIEFAFGLNPNSGASVMLPQAQRLAGYFVVTFTEPAGITGVTYGADWSPALAAGSWLPVPDTGSGGTHTFSVPIGSHTEMFIRLKVIIQ